MIATENLQYVAAGVIAAPLVIIVGAEAAAAAGGVAAVAKTVASAAVRIHTGYTWVTRLVNRLRSRVKKTQSSQPSTPKPINIDKSISGYERLIREHEE